MNQTKEKIISSFKEKSPELSTRDIAENIYEEYIREPRNDNEKRLVAQLHRKALHHINLLIRDGILRISRHGEKGHKYFSLNLEEGEEITSIGKGYKRRIIALKPSTPIMPIEGYEQQGIVIKHEAGTWIDRLNSILIKCEKSGNLKNLEDVIRKAFSSVNDSVCLNNFDSLINDKKEVLKFLEKLNQECEDYGRKVSCLINLENLNQDFLEILKDVLENRKEIIFIYNIDSDVLQECFGTFENIINTHISNKSEIRIKNRRIQKSPAFFGRAGPYSFSEKEWLEDKNSLSVACAQSSLIVDVEKFYEKYGLNVEKFSELMINISKSFLSANAMQRKKSLDYFRDLINLDKENEKNFMELSRNYIRFWNFGLNQPGINQDLVLNMISEAKKRINELAGAEEIIYKSCGMPIRFKIALSCAFENSEDKLSEARYKKLAINGLEDLYNKNIKKEVIKKEIISDLFDGGNEVTFHRFGELSPEEIIREISFILNTYKLNLFTYSFENIRGNSKLTSYL